jgi:uncharacterized circularly permuted ATP-grasp superfamily protein
MAEFLMRDQGITFNVYGKSRGVEQIIPFDPMPRLIPDREWRQIERGLTQRILALNLFLKDIYHQRLILRDNVIPADVVLGSSGYRRECVGLKVPRDIYVHIAGIDQILPIAIANQVDPCESGRSLGYLCPYRRDRPDSRSRWEVSGP